MSKIILEVGGRELEPMTLEEAKQLFIALQELFGDKGPSIEPSRQPLTPYPQVPTRGPYWYPIITRGDSSSLRANQ